MTKQDFIANYCRRGDLSEAFFHKHMEAVPCACGEFYCQGWKAVDKPEDAETSPTEEVEPWRD